MTDETMITILNVFGLCFLIMSALTLFTISATRGLGEKILVFVVSFLFMFIGITALFIQG